MIDQTSVLSPLAQMAPDERRHASQAITQLWDSTVQSPYGELRDDLQRLKRWFDPVAQGQRLRREISALPALPMDWIAPPQPFVARVSARQYLVTPEGRCAVDAISTVAFADLLAPPISLLAYDALLAEVYREWGRHRLSSVIDLLSGESKPLQVAAAGVVLALLVNRCTSEKRALIRFAAGQERDLVDRAFFAPVQAFCDVFAPARRGNRNDPRLVSGWMLYEAGRRIGPDLVLIDAKNGKNGKAWIRESAVDGVLDLIARELQRGHRARANRQLLAVAFDALVSELRRSLPSLAQFGLVHERPTDTKRLRTSLLDASDRVDG